MTERTNDYELAVRRQFSSFCKKVIHNAAYDYKLGHTDKRNLMEISMDDLFDEVKDEILQGMRKGITTDVQSLDYLMIAKYYERIGDHATNIAEWVVYSINGHHKGE